MISVTPVILIMTVIFDSSHVSDVHYVCDVKDVYFNVESHLTRFHMGKKFMDY
jgi:hypothetical protein